MDRKFNCFDGLGVIVGIVSIVDFLDDKDVAGGVCKVPCVLSVEQSSATMSSFSIERGANKYNSSLLANRERLGAFALELEIKK